jgi:hypothetical protein
MFAIVAVSFFASGELREPLVLPLLVWNKKSIWKPFIKLFVVEVSVRGPPVVFS